MTRFDPIEWRNGNGKVRYQPRIGDEALFYYGSLGQWEWGPKNRTGWNQKTYRSRRRAIRVATREARNRAENKWAPWHRSIAKHEM